MDEDELEELLCLDASNQVKEAYLHLQRLFDQAIANNVLYYKTILKMQEDHKSSLASLHSDYESKYARLSQERGFEKRLQDIFSAHKKWEFMLNTKLNNARDVASLLECENNYLRNELEVMKKSLGARYNEGVSFLEQENSQLREEIETLKKSKVVQSSKQLVVARPTVVEERMKKTLADQATLIKNQTNTIKKITDKVDMLPF